MHIGVKLKQLRQAAGLTQEQLAEAAGLPLGTLRNYEQGRYALTWDVLWKMAPALGVGQFSFYNTFLECLDGGPAPSDGRGRPPKR